MQRPRETISIFRPQFRHRTSTETLRARHSNAVPYFSIRRSSASISAGRNRAVPSFSRKQGSGRARNSPPRGMTLYLSWWPKGGLKSELPHRVVTGRSAFGICSTQIMKITRWARRALVMILDRYALRLEHVRQCDLECLPE